MTALPSSELPVGSELGNLRLQRLILRVVALLSLIVVPAVLLPNVALEKLAWLLGSGQAPQVPLLTYLLGGGCTVYLAAALLLWIMSGDVVRYHPLVVVVGWVYVVGAPLLLWIAWTAGMPRWWILMDLLSCLITGPALLWACRPRVNRGAAAFPQSQAG